VYLVQQLNYKFCLDFLLSSVICISSTVETDKLNVKVTNIQWQQLSTTTARRERYTKQ